MVGGTSSITACGAARLGLRTAMAGVVGDDLFGRFMLAELARMGVDTAPMVIDPGQPTGVSTVLVEPADRATLTFRGTIGALKPAMVPDELLARTRHVHSGGYFLQGAAALLTDVFQRAHTAGATTSLDPGADPDGRWDGGLSSLLPHLDHLLPNAAEARALTGLAIGRGGGNPAGRRRTRGARQVRRRRRPGGDRRGDPSRLRAPGRRRRHDRRRRQHRCRLAGRDPARLAARPGRAAWPRSAARCRRGAPAARRRSRRSRRRPATCDRLRMAANPSIDRLFEVDRLRPGAVHRPESFVQVAGGKGVNVARAAAALGAEVQVLAILAGHAGRWLAQELEAAGIPVDAVWVEGETRSSLSVADQAGAGLTEFYERGAGGRPWRLGRAGRASRGAQRRRRVDDGIRLAAAGRLAAGLPRPRRRLPCGARHHRAVAAARRADQAERRRGGALTGLDTGSADGALAAARELSRGAAAAAVTRGADGAVLVADDGSAVAGTLDAPGRYPVGSGDAFLAGLVVARAAGAGWADAARLALGAAAANAAVPGAGRFERVDAERLAGLAAVSPI